MRLRPVATIAATVGLLLGPTSASASSEHFNPPKHYYLALGDSLAYGYQYAKFLAEFPNIDATSFDTGYVDDLAARLRTVRPGIQTVNYGCPGETTASYFTGCAYQATFPLHVGYSGSQAAAALAFLRAHHGQVSPITPILPSSCQRIRSLCPPDTTNPSSGGRRSGSSSWAAKT